MIKRTNSVSVPLRLDKRRTGHERMAPFPSLMAWVSTRGSLALELDYDKFFQNHQHIFIISYKTKNRTGPWKNSQRKDQSLY
ncbi:hypothetical protein NLX69_05095 [Rossellomorea sp. BNER]|nr:hypothetical protein [Rossellomorea sp. BNER]